MTSKNNITYHITKFIFLLFISLSCHHLHTIRPVVQGLEYTFPSTYEEINSYSNYYQTLGLLPQDYYNKILQLDENSNNNNNNFQNRKRRQNDRFKIKQTDIKKAYRKQAQLWHPDKVASRLKMSSSSNKNQTKTTTTTLTNQTTFDELPSNISVEECNARFAKIAEAYEILGDDTKRQEYDLYLLDVEDYMIDVQKQQQQQQQRQTKHNQYSNKPYQHQQQYPNHVYHQTMFDDFHNDPMSVFEEFFFGKSNQQQQPHQHQHQYYHQNHFFPQDIFDSFFGGTNSNPQYNNNQRRQRQQQQQDPDRIQEATQVRYDQRLRQEVHRVLHREEYDDYQLGQTYFRVIGQEFIEEYDGFYGYSKGYMPITEPYLVEEGYIPLQQHSQKQGSNRYQNDFYDNSDMINKQNGKQSRHVLSKPSSKLFKNQFITPESSQLQSNNKHYRAGLTTDCELIIVHIENPQDDDDNDDDETVDSDDVIFSSESFIPSQYRHYGCSLSLYGAQLAVVVGDVNDPIAVLWNTNPPPITPSDSSSDELEYYASLDDDGNLAIYRKRGSSSSNNDDDDDYENENEYQYQYNDMDSNEAPNILTHIIRWCSHLIHINSTRPPQTRADAAWRSLKNWTIQSFSKHYHHHNKPHYQQHHHHNSHENKSKNKQRHGDECIYASGPAGCVTPGRIVIHISANVKRSIGKLISKMDGVWEDFVESLSNTDSDNNYYNDDDDDDILDTFLRVVGKVGNMASGAGLRMVKNRANDAKKAAKSIRDSVMEKMVLK